MTINRSSRGGALVRRALNTFLALSLSALLLLPWAALLDDAWLSSAAGGADDAALYQALLDLTNPWTVMCVAAHPDDEDGATLTMLRRRYGVHTVTLFSTYGEGGQNAVGPELYEELGAIRARETIAAAEIQGSEAYFLGLRDFGFSKSAEEAFRVWGHDEALRRMVLQIRRLRPDVIITNHDTTSGHGHHQATGRLVLEAFDAAADPTRFPEQLHGDGGLSVWQAQRLFVRRFEGGGTGSKEAEGKTESADGVVSIDVNERDPAWGSTYAQQALRALQRHATQGPWPQTVPASGWPLIRYRLARTAKEAPPLPRNAPSFLEGMALPQEAARWLSPPSAKTLLSLYAATGGERERVLGALVTTYKERGLTSHNNSNSARSLLMFERFDRALAVASGVSINFEPRDEPLIPNVPAAFNINIQNRGGVGVTVQSLSFSGGGQGPTPVIKEPIQVAPGKSIVVTAEYAHTGALNINVPHAAHLYDGRVFGEQFRAEAIINLDGAQFPLAAKTTVDVAPAVEIKSITPSPIVLTPATLSHGANLTFHLVNHESATFKGVIRSHELTHTMHAGPWFGLAAHQTGEFDRTFAFPSARERGDKGGRTNLPDAVKFSILRVGDEHPVTEETVRVAYSDARVAPRLRVGYVRSFDDTLRDALAALGVEAKELTVADVRTGDLKGYDTILIDIRGYQAHPELVAANSRLLEYASAGGTLIVFYHKTNEWNPDPQKNRPQLAPYPIIAGNERVTDENAPVTFVEPQHALLNFPNKITQEDFAGWIQERGLYYPKQWDEHYSAPLASSDTGEQPLRGGLLAADYGRGRYIYTSMVWYRQLRAGVPGAYRMFANMLSYGHAEMRNADFGWRIKNLRSQISDFKFEIPKATIRNPKSVFRNHRGLR
jgi:LmbE family N-acetylglucosaminyl deacetylase